MKNLVQVLFLAILSLGVWADEYAIVTEKSKVGFSIIKFKIGQPVNGQFKEFEGSVNIDPKTQIIEKINATIKVKSIDTADEKRDEHLNNEDFFNEPKFPTITFKNLKPITLSNKKEFVISGELTMKGVTKIVELNATIKEQKDNTVHVIAKTKLNRLDYGVSWNKDLEEGAYKTVLGILGKTVLDNNVDVELQIFAQKK